MNAKKWFIKGVLSIFMSLCILAATTVVIDPLFHYHTPLEGLKYSISNQRYQNDGIVKNFQYDALITGTSMTENFKTSEFNRLFNVNSVKVPLVGASYKEIGDMLQRATMTNSDIKYIIWGLDYKRLLDDKDFMMYDNYPTYLYDDNPWNDLNYLLNKDIFIKNTAQVLFYTIIGRDNMDFDVAYNWMDNYEFGKDAVDKIYQRPERVEKSIFLNREEKIRLEENLEQNVISVLEKNPNIHFYLFFPPYSIYYWDKYNQMGMLDYQLETEKRAIELLVEYDNVFLFSFTDNMNLITKMDYYSDTEHYGEAVNSKMLEWMKKGEYRLTKDNYMDYCRRVRENLMNYNYDSLFADI